MQALTWEQSTLWSAAGFLLFCWAGGKPFFARAHILFRLGLLILCGPLVWVTSIFVALGMLRKWSRQPIEPPTVPFLAPDPLETMPPGTLSPTDALVQILGEHVQPNSGTYLSNRAYQLGLRALQAEEARQKRKKKKA